MSGIKVKRFLLGSIGVNPSDVITIGAFWQFKTTTKNLFVCEFKFKRQELEADVTASVQKK